MPQSTVESLCSNMLLTWVNYKSLKRPRPQALDRLHPSTTGPTTNAWDSLTSFELGFHTFPGYRSSENCLLKEKKTHEIASNNMSKLQILKDTAASGPGQTGSGSKSATSATSLLSSASASPRTKRKYKETLNFVSFHSKVNMRRKWRSKKSAFYKFVDLESDFDSSELNAYTVGGQISFFFSWIEFQIRKRGQPWHT